MICAMLNKAPYAVGSTIASLLWPAVLVGLTLAYGRTIPQVWELCVVLLLSVRAGVVAHELGHLLACLVVGVKVTAFRLGNDRVAIRFLVGEVKVSVGWPDRGRVEHEGTASAARQATITLAGPLTNLVLGGVALAASQQGTRPLLVAAALGTGVLGLINLMPVRLRSGRPSDGARLLTLRSISRAAEAVKTMKAAGKLYEAGRTAELLELHAGLEIPDGRINDSEAASLTGVEYWVALLPGLPDADASLAERRVSLLLRRHDLGSALPVAYQTLAMLRLRQREPGAQAEAEGLCDKALAVKALPDSVRCLVLATVIVSRQERGLPYDDVLAATAATLDTTKHRPGPAAAVLRVALDPERFLDAFRAGVQGTRLGAGSLAAMLRRQGRIDELLELHNGFELPAGTYRYELALSLYAIEYHVLIALDRQRAVIDEAASRVEWILARYPFNRQAEAPDHGLTRRAMEHTVALARLRQGRFEEVAPLCASAMAGEKDPDNRATVLATVALARRALGQPHADLLAEALALSPNADLVAEAAEATPLAEAKP